MTTKPYSAAKTDKAIILFGFALYACALIVAYINRPIMDNKDIASCIGLMLMAVILIIVGVASIRRGCK